MKAMVLILTIISDILILFIIAGSIWLAVTNETIFNAQQLLFFPQLSLLTAVVLVITLILGIANAHRLNRKG